MFQGLELSLTHFVSVTFLGQSSRNTERSCTSFHCGATGSLHTRWSEFGEVVGVFEAEERRRRVVRMKCDSKRLDVLQQGEKMWIGAQKNLKV